MSDHPNPEQLTHAVRPAGRAKKTVRPVQREIDALPLGSGDWSVAGIPGLVVRCGRRSKSFRLQRRVRGKVVWRVLGQITVAEARRAAMSEWVRLKPRPPQTRITLAEAWQRCLSEKRLSEKSRFLFQYNLDRYLADWKNRTLEEMGDDRPGVREFFLNLAGSYGLALAHQVMRQLRAVYRYHQKVAPDLPECPTVVVELPPVTARDWALSDEELRQWWAAVQQLNPTKRMFWLTLLLTGARRGRVLGSAATRQGYPPARRARPSRVLAAPPRTLPLIGEKGRLGWRQATGLTLRSWMPKLATNTYGSCARSTFWRRKPSRANCWMKRSSALAWRAR
jgi:hypothetical protein